MNSVTLAGKFPLMADTLLDRIDERLRVLGLSDRAASMKAGLGEGAIRDLRRRGPRSSMHGRSLERLAAALETSPSWLLGQGEAPEASAPAAPMPVETRDALGPAVRVADVGLPARAQMPEDVPVLGTAFGSVIRQVEGFQFEGGQIDTVRRPPALAGAKDLYAIYVEGDSMFPAHPAGELRFVHPHRPCQVGDSVVVVTRHHDGDPGQAYIKVLQKRSLGKIYLRQYNPEAILEIDMRFVVSIHRVLTTGELFGV